MGTDIRLHAEVKIEGEWHHYAVIPFVRWYGAFTKMCGVRGDISELSEVIALPRGLPGDVTKVVKFLSDKDGGHSHSWLSSDEIAAFCRWLKTQKPYKKPAIMDHFDLEWESGVYFFGNVFDYKNYQEDPPEGVDDVRFVFWFDC